MAASTTHALPLHTPVYDLPATACAVGGHCSSAEEDAETTAMARAQWTRPNISTCCVSKRLRKTVSPPDLEVAALYITCVADTWAGREPGTATMNRLRIPCWSCLRVFCTGSVPLLSDSEDIGVHSVAVYCAAGSGAWTHPRQCCTRRRRGL